MRTVGHAAPPRLLRGGGVRQAADDGLLLLLGEVALQDAQVLGLLGDVRLHEGVELDDEATQARGRRWG